LVGRSARPRLGLSETFPHLPEADQLEVLQLAAERLGRRAAMLEKDVWVIWTLEQLFKLEGRNTGISGLRGARVPSPQTFRISSGLLGCSNLKGLYVVFVEMCPQQSI
jgi:hypothetical protein